MSVVVPREMPVVVVGAGIAGVSAVAAMRAAGSDEPVLLVGDEPQLPYRRPAVSKELVSGAKTVEQVRIKPEQWYADNGVDLVTGTRATSLDPRARLLTLGDGSQVRYDRLLLATGGRARSPQQGTWEGERVRTLRTAADAEALVASLEGVEHVLVVGAGLVGSEIAAALRGLDREVTVLEAAPHPLPRLLPATLAARCAALHAEHGTKLETGVEVSSVQEHADEVVVSAADGRSWSAGLVVVSVGMQPRLDLLEPLGAAGAAEPGGVLVDWAGRTSLPGIFAAGDVARRPSSFVPHPIPCEHWQGAQNHGAAVGRSLAGEDVRFDEVPWAWSDQYGVNLQVTGWPDARDRFVVRGDVDGGAFTAVAVRDGVIRGAVTVGRPADVRAARQLVAQRARVDLDRLADPDVAVGETVVT